LHLAGVSSSWSRCSLSKNIFPAQAAPASSSPTNDTQFGRWIRAEALRELVDSDDAADLPPLSSVLVRCLELPAELPADLAIGEVAEITGVSAHTLRYYERIGLLEVDRDAGGRRTYDSEALARVVFVTRLRMSDMPIRDIARYLALVNRGEATVPARLALMQAHRTAIQRRLQDLRAALAVIDYKIVTYGGHCSP
jgi:DNA-binding transcriptional MerR regulator